MAKIIYKGMELEEFTSGTPVAFPQGTKAVCWDADIFGECFNAELNVIAYLPYMGCPVLTDSGDGRQDSSWFHCAILPQTQEAKEARMIKTKNSRTATGEYYDGGEVETIVYLEGLITALIKNGVEPRRAHNIVAATKYLSSRLGAKADQPIELDLMKAENYIHRARTGKWLPKERLDPFGE